MLSNLRLQIEEWVQLMTNQKSEICLRRLRQKISEGGEKGGNKRNGRMWENVVERR